MQRTGAELDEYDKLLEAAEFVKRRADISPRVGILCGSGLGDLVDIIERPVSRLLYSQIPHFPQSTVEGHPGELVLGFRGHIPVVCMRGRCHLYEGYQVLECIRPVRLMALLGVRLLCLTNAAGNLNSNSKPGDFMLITDHISFPTLAGENPLRGRHDSRFGERFLSMSNAYNRELMDLFELAGARLGLSRRIRRGIYAMAVGPSYETPSEGRAMRSLGADAVGMSTVHELIAAHQMSLKCLAVSLLTSDIALEDDSPEKLVGHESVVEASAQSSADLIKLLLKFISSAEGCRETH